MKKIVNILACAFLLCTCFGAKTSVAAVAAQSGILNLSEHDLYTDGKVRLDGEWAFYQDGSITPASFKNGQAPEPTGFFPVPRYWTEYEGLSLSSKAEVTYRLKIRVKHKNRLLSLQTPEIFTEYRLFINGQLFDSHGRYADGNIRFLSPQVFTFQNEQDTIEILLNISNHSHSNAGIGQSFFLGSPEEIEKHHLFSTILEIILVAVCIFAGIYHIILFLLRRKEVELLYFGLFCIALAIRTVTTGTTFIMQLAPSLPFETGSRLATLMIPLCVLFFVSYAYYFFQAYFPKLAYQVFSLLHIVYAVAALILPSMQYSWLFTPYLIIILATCLLVIGVNIEAVLKKSRYSVIFLAGFVFTCAGVLNDILHYLQIINTGYFLSLWFACFIAAQSAMLAIKFANEHKMVEELSKRLQISDRLKDEFLANTSHELRTPLNGIIGISESLIDGIAGELPPKATENLNLISSSGKRLTSLINDILDISKLRNDDINLSFKDIDLRQVVEVVLTVIRATTSFRRLELINEIGSRFPLVRADENRLQQILFNIVGNAVKFTEKGQVKVSAKDRGTYVLVRVEDTGPGIPEHMFESIFQPFEQIDGTTTREQGGTGLGLSITKKLVELQGGRINVQSDGQTGSIFSFTLPKSQSDQPSATLPSSDLKKDRIDRKKGHVSIQPESVPDAIGKSGEKILIVDDDTTNIRVLENYLLLENYRVRSATNGIEALEILEKEKFDLILLDIMMPRMSGYEVLNSIRKQYTTYELPVLMLTAGTQNRDIVTAFQSGANDYLTKPIDRQELTARIKTHLSLRQAVVTAIENATLANTDALTGLYNRRFMTLSGDREFSNALRMNKPLSVIMLDIDLFKQINDLHGHAEGDRVLKHLAETITRNIRGIDIAVRYGGEEFVIILPETVSDGAARAAEKIRQLIEKSTVLTSGHYEIHYTVSMGVASSEDSESTFEDLILTADKMLYQSKKAGRNCITVFKPEKW